MVMNINIFIRLMDRVIWQKVSVFANSNINNFYSYLQAVELTIILHIRLPLEKRMRMDPQVIHLMITLPLLLLLLLLCLQAIPAMQVQLKHFV